MDDNDVPSPRSTGHRPRPSRTLALVIASILLTVGAAEGTSDGWEAPAWDTLTLDSFGGLSANSGLSVAMDSRGDPHVAYYALKGADLRYATRSGATWSTETVDDFQVVGPDCSIALDADDRPHICYYDKTNEELEYAVRNGTGWDTETVDHLGIVGVGTSIAVDPSGDPYMVYVGARTIRCAHREGDGWNVTVVDDGEAHVYTPSVAIDGDGVPHVLYLGAGTVKHAYLEEGAWVRETVDDLRIDTFAMGTTLRIDGEGDLVACYANDAATSVVVATRSDGQWTCDRVSRGHYLGDLDMELDADGDPRIALIDMAFDADQELVNTDVWYMERQGDEWREGVALSSVDAHGVLLDLHMAGDEPCLAIVDLDPDRMEADLLHLTDWTGDYLEPYAGDPVEDPGGGGEGTDGIDDAGDGMASNLVASLAISLTLVAMFAIYMALRREEGDGDPPGPS